MAESVVRYRIEEFQDHQGNIIYPQTEARGVWVDDISLYVLLNTEVTDEQISNILNS